MTRRVRTAELEDKEIVDLYRKVEQLLKKDSSGGDDAMESPANSSSSDLAELKSTPVAPVVEDGNTPQESVADNVDVSVETSNDVSFEDEDADKHFEKNNDEAVSGVESDGVSFEDEDAESHFGVKEESQEEPKENGEESGIEEEEEDDDGPSIYFEKAAENGNVDNTANIRKSSKVDRIADIIGESLVKTAGGDKDQIADGGGKSKKTNYGTGSKLRLDRRNPNRERFKDREEIDVDSKDGKERKD